MIFMQGRWEKDRLVLSARCREEGTTEHRRLGKTNDPPRHKNGVTGMCPGKQRNWLSWGSWVRAYLLRV